MTVRYPIRVRLLSLVTMLSLLGVPGELAPAHAQSAPQWPVFQHDLQHTGRSPYVGPSAAGTAWTFTPQGQAGDPAIGSDGTIYLPAGMLNRDETGVLHAINPDGSLKWTADLIGPPSTTAPGIGPDGTIYVNANGREGNIAAINGITAIDPSGTKKWTFEFNDGAGSFTSDRPSSPTVASDGTIWVGSSDTFLYALNPDGTIKCDVSPTVSSIDESPAIGTDGTVYIIDVTNTLFAVSPSCDILWDFALADHTAGSRGSPSVGPDGTIYAGTNDEVLYGINPDGTMRCSFDVGSTIRSTPAIDADGTVYVGAGGLYALTPGCTQKWKRYDNTLFSSASPVIGGDGTVYWRESFLIHAVSPDGTELFQMSVQPGSQPTAQSGFAIGSQGHLYLGDGGAFDDEPRFRAIDGIATEPEPEPERPSYERSIGLRLRRHLVARGTVSSTDPSATCRTRRVVIQRKNFFGWRKVATANPGPDGAFRVKLRDRPGRYRAKAPRFATDELVCKPATSIVRRHRH